MAARRTDRHRAAATSLTATRERCRRAPSTTDRAGWFSEQTARAVEHHRIAGPGFDGHVADVAFRRDDELDVGERSRRHELEAKLDLAIAPDREREVISGRVAECADERRVHTAVETYAADRRLMRGRGAPSSVVGLGA